MAITNSKRIEVDIIIREYETRYYDEKDGSKISEVQEVLISEVRQNMFGSLIEAVKYLVLKIT
jgi:hypothetical protein